VVKETRRQAASRGGFVRFSVSVTESTYKLLTELVEQDGARANRSAIVELAIRLAHAARRRRRKPQSELARLLERL